MTRLKLLEDYLKWVSQQAKIYHDHVHGIELGFLKCEMEFCVKARAKMREIAELI